MNKKQKQKLNITHTGAFHGIVLVERVGVALASITDNVENEQAASARRLLVELRFLATATRKP